MGERETAYHEAGHCLVGYCRYQHIDHVTILPEMRDGKKNFGHTCWSCNWPGKIRASCRDVGGDIAERILGGETEINLDTTGTETRTETHCFRSFPGCEETGRFWYDPEIRYETKKAIYEKVVILLQKHWEAV